MAGPRPHATVETMRTPIGMDVRRFFAFAIALFALASVPACQTANNSPPADAFVPLPDAAIGVACNGAVCSTDTGCCAATGGSPFCMTVSGTGGTCSGRVLKCDGPEDCTGGTTCCNLNNGDSACQTINECQADGTITCNSDPDCPEAVPHCCNRMCSADACNFW